MNRFLVLLMSLVLALPVQALDLQGLYEQALTASRQGDFVEALPLWDRFLEQAPEDAAALATVAMCVSLWVILLGPSTIRALRSFWRRRKATRI